MNYADVHAEIIDQWPPLPAGDPRIELADQLTRLSLIAWKELAVHRTGDEDTVVRSVATKLGSRSTKSRTVLRLLIDAAQQHHQWEPTVTVKRAAGTTGARK